MDRICGQWQWSLFQDNAKYYTTELMIAYLQDCCNFFPKLISKLSDFNPIENLWSIIKGRVEDIQRKSIDDLIDLSFQTWESITMNENHELFDSPPNRLNACTNAKGMQIGY